MEKEFEAFKLVTMYVGNLEMYQGIDLLLESFALVLLTISQCDLVIVGGQVQDIQKYQNKACQLGVDRKVHFLGPKPVTQLAQYLSRADILVSPRIKGTNTPMKIYSYLQSGKPILATNLPTHTQLLTSQIAMLAEPSPEAFSRAMIRLIGDEKLRMELGLCGKKLVEEKFSFTVFREKLNSLYDWLTTEIDQSPRVDSGASQVHNRLQPGWRQMSRR